MASSTLSRLLGAAAAYWLFALSPAGNAQPLVTEFPLPTAGPVNAVGPFFAHAMTTGSDGNLWFTHYTASKVCRMTAGGQLTAFDLAASARPSGLTAGPDQNIWFLTTGEPKGVGRMSPSGQYIHFPINALSFPSGLVAASDGNMWFTEATLEAEATGPDPTATAKISPAGAVVQYALPLGYSGTGIVNAPEGNLWFVYSSFSVRGGSSSGLERISLAGVRSTVADPSAFDSIHASRPGSIAPGPDGNVWFVGGASVGKVTSAGQVTAYPIPTANPSALDITAGPDGNLWFTEYDGNKIGRVTPLGVITEFDVPTLDSGPAAICVGPDGNIWFTESKANKVGRLALSGPASGKVTLTIPTAASKAGLNGTFFHTDLWLMNRSFTSATPLTLVYRCSGGQRCGNGSQVLSIAPRQEVMLADVIGQTLGAPGTSGAIEVSWPTSAGPVSASSRVSSPLPPDPAFGTMIPALPQTATRTRALFLGLSWGGSLNSGSRSNAGAYNPNETPVDVTFTLRDGDGTILGALTRTYAPQESYQLSPNIFDLLGVGSVVTSNAYLVVTATAPVFPYVTVVDNVSGDSSFLPASDDEAEP